MILRYFNKRDWATAAVCVAFLVAQIYFDLKIPEYMTYVTRAIESSQPTSVIYGYGAEMMGCVAASLVVSVLCAYFAVLTSTSVCRTLRTLIFEKVEDFSPQDVGRFSVDSLITRCSNDITQVQTFLVQALQTLVKMPIISVWAILKISGAEWEWTFATAMGVVLLACVTFLIIKVTRPGYRKVPVITDKINHFSLEMMTGLRVVRAYNKERFQEQKYEGASNELMDVSVFLWNRGSLLPALTSGTSNLLTLVIYWTGITLIAASTDSVHNVDLFSNMIVFSSYAVQVIASFMAFASLIQFSGRSFASLARVEELISYSPTIVDGDYTGPGTEKGTVEFDHVNFSYPETGAEVLHDISFRVEEGETLAILGPTGSGKSTLAGLILRLYEADGGEIKVDGVDVRTYDPDNLYSKLGYVPQSNVLFSGTIEENVNFGADHEKHGADDVKRALEVAQASEFVDDLPERTGYALSEGAKNLSGGQRQRLSVARAICKDAEICILDDPFSALDFATDKRLRTALKESCRDTTVIMITQRVGTAMDADKIMVLDEGRIIGFGRHDELMETCPLYKDIATSQMVGGTV